jgi:hypothetical protein
MSQSRIISIFLCCFLVAGCTSSATTRKVHHHGAKINIADFIHHTAAYKGKTITLILKLDHSSAAGKILRTDDGGRELKFTTVGPKGEQLNLIITIPQEMSLPNEDPSGDLMVTFVCSQGSLRQGNHAKAIQIPDGTEDD